jgi:DNA polymerase III subunit delta'
MTSRNVFDDLIGQPKVASFLSTATAAGAVTHAYLFVGPQGSGKKKAAKALACALVCGDGGCGACSACQRIRKGFHPDVRVFEPEGAASYMVEQVRDLIHDVTLSPIDASVKVYIIDRAEALGQQAANALLKTLEEPPPDAVLVLLATSFDAVLPTIASRCQVVRFSQLAPATAIAVLVQRAGVTPAEAREALAASGGVLPRALDFLRSGERREMRAEVLTVLKDLGVMDAFDVMRGARGLLASVKAPLDELKTVQAAELKDRTEFLGGKVSNKPVEDRHKRELTAREREGVNEVLNVAESWLRDCLTLSVAADELVENADAIDTMEEIAAVITPAAGLRALAAVTQARRRVAANVGPQLALEAMLFDIQEVYRCPR